jgi:hypothetical protein
MACYRDSFTLPLPFASANSEELGTTTNTGMFASRVGSLKNKIYTSISLHEWSLMMIMRVDGGWSYVSTDTGTSGRSNVPNCADEYGGTMICMIKPEVYLEKNLLPVPRYSAQLPHGIETRESLWLDIVPQTVGLDYLKHNFIHALLTSP